MRPSQRMGRAAVATTLAVVIGGTGVAVGAAAAGSGDTPRPAAVTEPATQDTTALAEVLASKDPGQSVTLTVSRGGQQRTVPVTLGELPGG
jgi:S1-C subfamily serine protease